MSAYPTERGVGRNKLLRIARPRTVVAAREARRTTDLGLSSSSGPRTIAPQCARAYCAQRAGDINSQAGRRV
jgi:hypothetical protein